jgi:hypothetical protein
MNHVWFRYWGWVYRPVTLLFCGQVFVAIDRHSHSASDTLYGIFPYFICAFVVLGWVAAHTSSQS